MFYIVENGEIVSAKSHSKINEMAILVTFESGNVTLQKHGEFEKIEKFDELYKEFDYLYKEIEPNSDFSHRVIKFDDFIQSKEDQVNLVNYIMEHTLSQKVTEVVEYMNPTSPNIFGINKFLQSIKEESKVS